MMSTRASTKRKRLTNSIVKNKRFKASGPSTNKQSRSIIKPQSITRSSISIHDDNLDMHDDSSLEKDSLVIDCPDQSEHDVVVTPKVVNSRLKDFNNKKGPLNSSTITTRPATTRDELTTEAAYEKLEAILPPPLLQATPTTNRINSSHTSQINRSEARADPYLSLTTNVRNTVNRPTTSSDCRRGSSGDIRHLGNNGLPNNNRNINETARNNTRASIISQSAPTNDRVTGQSAVSFSSTNLTLLESLPEYRTLKKELAHERQRCITWSEDYMKLRTEFDNYRASSFPRSSVDGLNFLLQLVENLTVPSISLDLRPRCELALAIGLTEEQLTECSHPNPQRAALLVFSRLYPTFRDRAALVNIRNFSKTKSELLDDIFVFARQCNPSTLYSMEKMREAIAGSIRQAKHQLVKLNNVQLELSAIENHIVDEDDVEQINDNNNSMMGVQKRYLNNNHLHDCSADDLDYGMDQQ